MAVSVTSQLRTAGEDVAFTWRTTVLAQVDATRLNPVFVP